METLKEHESEFWNHYEHPKTEDKCGVECPKCKKELFADTTAVLLSSPLQHRIFCKNCDFVGSMHYG